MKLLERPLGVGEHAKITQFSRNDGNDWLGAAGQTRENEAVPDAIAWCIGRLENPNRERD